MTHRHPVNVAHHDEASLGERIADRAAAIIGSWNFLIAQTLIVTAWIAFNLVSLVALHWDPFPFILLNLMFSLQAAYTGPMLLLAGNRQAQKDRLTLEHAAAEGDKADDQNQQILRDIATDIGHSLAILEHLRGPVAPPSAAPGGPARPAPREPRLDAPGAAPGPWPPLRAGDATPGAVRATRSISLFFAPVGPAGVAPILPTRAYHDDAGLDLYVTEEVTVKPGEFMDIHCHAGVQLPENVWALIIGRSSTLRKRGLMVNPGIIDTGYRGELFTGVWNLTDAPVRVQNGERLAQIILFHNLTHRYAPVFTSLLGETDRGDQGFGSSGQ